MKANEATEQIIASAIEVHRALGPGLFESAYEACLAYELTQRGVYFQRQSPLPVVYKDVVIDCGAIDSTCLSTAKSSSSSKRLIGSRQSTRLSCFPTSNFPAATLVS